MTPFSIRRERSGEVFTFMRRWGEYIKRDKEENGEVVVRNGERVLLKPAGDNWF